MSRFAENTFSLIKYSLNNVPIKKWNSETVKILKLIENQLTELSNGSFPMSLSLYQICYGILLCSGIISEDVSKKYPFHKSDIFEIVFPASKNFKIKEFEINTVGNK
jgi:hypothetical protein